VTASHHGYMSEKISVKGAIGFDAISIGSTLVDELIDEGKLPHDFEFRALGLDQAERSAIVRKDIFAALGRGKLSGDQYLDGPLPDCVFIPYDEERTSILKRVDDVYYQASDLRRAGKHEGAALSRTYRVWAGFVERLNPCLYDYFELADVKDSTGKISRDAARNLNGIVIRDEPLLEHYRTFTHSLGTAAIEYRLLHFMLLENHMELGLLD